MKTLIIWYKETFFTTVTSAAHKNELDIFAIWFFNKRHQSIIREEKSVGERLKKIYSKKKRNKNTLFTIYIYTIE